MEGETEGRGRWEGMEKSREEKKRKGMKGASCGYHIRQA